MRSKKKLLLSIVIIMMVIVFAVGTTEVFLHGSINISDSDDLDVYFSKAILDEEEKNELIIDKKHIVYETGYLKDPSEESELVYEVANNSKQYDANINITCRTDKEDLVNIVIEPNEIEIKSGERKEGSIKVNTKKYVVDETTANISCELNVEAIERTEIGDEIVQCDTNPGKTWEFETVGEDEFEVPCDGEYKLEVWGAQGGSYDETYYGGYGTYSTGNVELSTEDYLSVVVGGEGLMSDTLPLDGGYNGGGSASVGFTAKGGTQYQGSGGGATHIAKNALLGELKNYKEEQNKILIVASGGGGSQYNYIPGETDYSSGGNGGSYIGMIGLNTNSNVYPYYAFTYNTITSGGYLTYNNTIYGASDFGQGGSFVTGGGGGFYGGFGGSFNGGAGGTSYINNSLNNKEIYCFGCIDSDDDIKTYNTSLASTTAIAMQSKKRNGYARITFVKYKAKTCSSLKNTTWEFDKVGEKEFKTPCSGNYKLEVWGAQGGSTSGYNGGYGGYSVGEIELKSNDKLYVNVGGIGGTSTKDNVAEKGYNGGGSGYYKISSYNSTENHGSGGGATHIAMINGELKNLELYKGVLDLSNKYYVSDKILIVAGGGGGSHYFYLNSNSYSYCHGGHGGGISGNLAECSISSELINDEKENTKATQIEGGKQTRYDNQTQQGGFGFGNDGLSGAGGGFFGGGAMYYNGAGGGSGYIANERLKNKAMYCYNCETSDDEETKTITEGVTAEEIATSGKAKKGSGYARITFLG